MTEGPFKVRVFGTAMIVSVVLVAVLGVVGVRILGPSDGEAPRVFQGLLYLSAAGLLLLTGLGPTLASRLPSTGQGGAGGAIVAIALTEGITMLGVVSGTLAGEPMWIVALAATALLAILRIQASAT